MGRASKYQLQEKMINLLKIQNEDLRHERLYLKHIIEEMRLDKSGYFRGITFVETDYEGKVEIISDHIQRVDRMLRRHAAKSFDDVLSCQNDQMELKGSDT